MKTAVHLHLYYVNQLPEHLSKLQNLTTAKIDFDLFVTTVVKDTKIEKQILEAFPEAKIWQVENRGYDIGPFIDFLHKIDFDKYEYIIKIHSKNQSKYNCISLNGISFNNMLWGSMLEGALLGNPKIIKQNYEKFYQNDKLGMIGSNYCLTSETKKYQYMMPLIQKECENLNISKPQTVTFVAGTMFMVRTKIFAPFLNVAINDFSLTDAKIKDMTKAHIYERLFGVAVIQAGMEIEGIKQKGYILKIISGPIMRFLYQERTKKSGDKLIKICKIPVWTIRNA